MRSLLLLTLAGCPSEPEPGAPRPEPEGTASTGVVDPTGDTAPIAPSAAAASVSRRFDLATWLGFDVVVDPPSASVELSCQSAVDPEERHVIAASSGAHGLHGLLADHPYRCALSHGGVELWASDERTDPLPAPLPALRRSGVGPADVQGGYLVTNQWRSGERVQRALILDPEGRIRWYRALEAPSGGVTVTWADGTILAGGGKGQPPTLLTLDGDQVFQSPPPPWVDGEHHHEVRRSSDGLLIGLMTERLEVDTDGDGVPDDRLGIRIQAHDPTTGALAFDYNVADYLDQWLPVLDTVDAYHANAVTWGDDGSSWVSLRSLDQVRRLDRATGQVTHTMGRRGDMTLLDAAGQPLDDVEWFFGQHAPEQHGDRFFIMDNGAGRPGPRVNSRAVEYKIDLQAKTATPVWLWTEPGWYCPYYGDVDLLPSGHVLVASGHCHDCPGGGGLDRSAFIVEVEPTTNTVLWRLDFEEPKDSIFRAQLVEGCEIFANQKYCSDAEGVGLR